MWTMSDEDKLVLSRALDLCNLSEKYHSARFTNFLTPMQQFFISEKLPKADFFGGYDGAERKIAAFYPEFMDKEDLEYPISCIEIMARGMDRIEHRDILGSLMSLGIKREKIGDIVKLEGSAVFFASEELSGYILDNLKKIANVGVKLQIKELSSLVLPGPRFKEIRGTIASLRLDAAVALAINSSRTKTVELIHSGMVNVNHRPVDEPSYTVNSGDVLSVRGYGKFLLHSVGSPTKKSRLPIVIKKYV